MGAQSYKILLLVLTGLLLLSVLSGCGPEYLTEEQVKEETLDYLSKLLVFFILLFHISLNFSFNTFNTFWTHCWEE